MENNTTSFKTSLIGNITEVSQVSLAFKPTVAWPRNFIEKTVWSLRWLLDVIHVRG